MYATYYRSFCVVYECVCNAVANLINVARRGAPSSRLLTVFWRRIVGNVHRTFV